MITMRRRGRYLIYDVAVAIYYLCSPAVADHIVGVAVANY